MGNTQRLHKKTWKRPQRGLALFLRLWLPMKNLLLPLDIATMQKYSLYYVPWSRQNNAKREAYKMRYTDGFSNVMMHLMLSAQMSYQNSSKIPALLILITSQGSMT
jgi:hypothetical protein